MHGKCQNCGELNCLTELKEIKKKVCPKCFQEFQAGNFELLKLQQDALEREKLREAFGKIGILEE